MIRDNARPLVKSTTAPHARRAMRRAFAAVAVGAVFAGGVFTTAPPAIAVPAGSSVTVAWGGEGNSPAVQALQPDRQNTWLSKEKGLKRSPHYTDFEDLSVTVSKTAGLRDEAVGIEVSGMPGGTVGGQRMPGIGAVGQNAAHQQNFLQVFQCWGDPLAEDFRETCQWGGVNDVDSPVDVTLASGRDSANAPLPFRSVQGKEYYWNEYESPEGATMLSEILSSSTSNELLAVPVKSDGTTSFGFEVQTAAQAPWLGCGALLDDGSPRSCSLVIVPRGTVYGGSEPTGSESGGGEASYGDQGAQVGPPVATADDHWDTRIVIPLNFEAPSSACGTGEARLVGGSELLVAAMGSWQTALCQGDGLAFNFTANADSQSRVQLAQGRLGLAYTSRSVTAEEVDIDDDVLAHTEFAYAPVAVAGITVSFQYTGQDGPVTGLRLSPRIIAKLLTQSYEYAIPDDGGGASGDSHAGPHLSERNPQDLTGDPEFRALNPDFPPNFTRNVLGDLVVAGPTGSDGYRLLWEYLQADDKARAFLSGEPDNVLSGDENNLGMAINPFYLPKGHPAARVPQYKEVPRPFGAPGETVLLFDRNADGQIMTRPVGYTGADGGPLSLAETSIDIIPRADESLAPGELYAGRASTRIDTVTYNPYATNLENVAQRVFRAALLRPRWDSMAWNGNELGAWKTQGRDWPPRVKILGVTDNASSERHHLATAQLQLPNRPGTFASPSVSALAAALSAQRPQGDASWPDLGALSTDAYPLTLLAYAAVNLTATDASERADYADLIEYAVTEGQTLGGGAGQLPPGYSPLSDELRTKALTAAQRIRGYTPSHIDPNKSDGPAADIAAGTPPGPPAALASALDPETPQTQVTQSTIGAAEASATPAAPASGVLGGALLAGAAGGVLAPLLLRRRGAG